MTFDEFINNWSGKPVDFDGIYPNQCMDLMHEYVYQVLGITDSKVLAAPTASLVYTGFVNIAGNTLFDKIDNTPTGVPQKGDIVFFGTSIGASGHVCIFRDGNATTFNSFDANWPTGSLPHIQSHSYNGVLGWLRLKGNIADASVSIAKSTFDQMRGKCDQWDKVSAYLSIDNKDLAGGDKAIAQIKDLQNNTGSKQNDLNSANQKIDSLNTQISGLTGNNKVLTDQVDTLQKQLKDCQSNVPTPMSNTTNSTEAPSSSNFFIKLLIFLGILKKKDNNTN
jgi:hypothetical protein